MKSYKNRPLSILVTCIALLVSGCSSTIVKEPLASKSQAATAKDSNWQEVHQEQAFPSGHGEPHISKQNSKLTTRSSLNIAYTPAQWPETLEGDLYRPNNNQHYPAVVLIHGGGWSSRSRLDTRKLAKRIAQQGFVVFNISYRFAPEHQFPAQIHDSQLAVSWLRARAEQYGLHADKIAAWGYSSGAHLAAMLGTISEGDALNTPYGGPASRVQAVVAGGTPADLRKYTRSGLVEKFLGAKHSENFALYEKASPAFHVSADDPPVFMYHGGADLLVRLNQPKDFQRDLERAGVASELYIQRLRGHMTMFVFDGAAFDKAINFLQRKLG